MPVPPVSPYNVVLTPLDVNPRLHTEQHALVAALGAPVQKSLAKSKSDSVVISKRAVTKSREGEALEDEPREHHEEMERVERLPDGTYHPRGR